MRLVAAMGAMVLTIALSVLGFVGAQICLYDIVFIEPETAQVYVGDTFEVFVGFCSGFELPHPPVVEFSLRWEDSLLDLLDWDPGWLVSPIVVEGEDHLNVTMGNPFGSTLIMQVEFRATSVGSSILDVCNANVFTGDGYVSIHPQPPLPVAVHNLDTGLNYTTIQDAIGAPETLDGHTIQVDAGIYFEHVTVDKSISLIGEDEHNTTIDGSRNGTAILVSADNVSISGFTVQNSGHLGSESGIYMYNSTFSHISHNLMIHNKYGVKFDWSDNNILESNVVLENDDGIYLTSSSSNNIIDNNVVEGNLFGITVGASNNIITNNSVTGSGRGIIVSSENNMLADNIVGLTTGDGILLIGSSSNNNTLIGNTVDSNEGCGIRIHSSSNNTLQSNTVSCSVEGIFVFTESNNNNLVGNTLSANTRGIYLLHYSMNNRLVANTAANNGIGIQLTQCCNNNTLMDNVAFSNNLGIGLKDSRRNVLTGNKILSNQKGILLEVASNKNAFSRNSFVNNTQQALIDDSFNTTWYTAHEGNYWSNYDGVDLDGDGIGDTPFSIDENNTDNYPLMNPYSWWTLADINYDLEVDIYDAVLVCIAYTATPSAPNWNPHCDIAEPYGVIDIYDVVVICINYGEEYTP